MRNKTEDSLLEMAIKMTFSLAMLLCVVRFAMGGDRMSQFLTIIFAAFFIVSIVSNHIYNKAVTNQQRAELNKWMDIDDE